MNKLRIKLLAIAFLMVPFFGLKAFEWAPDGNAVDVGDVTSYATTDGDYAGGDVITADEGLDANGSFYANAEEVGEVGANTVNIYGTIDQSQSEDKQCPLKINGDVTLGAVDADLTVNIKTPVTIESYRGHAGGPDQEDGALLVFEAAEGKKVTVNVDYDLTFRGMTDDPASGDAEGYSNLYIAFKGVGQTVFKMADGTVIKFDGQVDTSTPAIADEGLIMPTEDNTYSANAGGTKVFVLMDQTEAQVNAGQNKVLFERKNNGDATLRTMIYVGPNSVFTYLSNNYQGLIEPTGAGIASDGKYYGAVGIDVSNPTGTGRMVLFIRGAYQTGWQTGEYTGGENPDPQFLQLIRSYPFNDGAVVVAGHSLTPTDPDHPFDAIANFRTAYDESAEIPAGFDFSAPAGVKAILRIVDNQAYATAAAADGFVSFNPTAAQRRGLLVVNDCQNLGKYASDPYWDAHPDNVGAGANWAYLNNVDRNVRLGFVLGVNGVLDIYDSAFLDYAGGASNALDLLAAADFNNSYLKKHNASAFIVDGFDARLYAELGNEHPFTAANPILGSAAVCPQIILRGNAKTIFKNAAATSSTYATTGDASTGFGPGYLVNFWARDPEAPEEDDLIGDPNVDFTMTLAVGQFVDGVLQKAKYDGYQLDNLSNETTGNPYTKTGEGEMVFDVEGNLSVTTVSNNTINVNAYVTTPTARVNATEAGAADGATPRSGVITLASVLTDHAGREINIATQTDQQTYTTALVTRPLLYNDTDKYARYNSPGLFINGKLSLYNTTYAHTDASKFVTGKPEESEPAITGGERKFFADEQYTTDAYKASDVARYRYPEFCLFSSELALHETLCASGLRFVIMDDPVNSLDAPITNEAEEVTYPSGSNLSVIRFYDHGQDLDALNTGYGRLFMLGSDLNLMEGGAEAPGPNKVTQSAFLNVFKRNYPQGLSATGADKSSTVKLALRNGNEFPSTVATADYEKQRSMHYIWFALPTTTGAQTGIFLGWPTIGKIEATDEYDVPVADDRAYPYKGETLTAEDKDVHWFKLDARTAATDALTGFDETADYWTPLPDRPAAQAELAIQGNFIGFNAMDNDGMGATVPVKDANDSGNIYVNYGGKMSITESPVDVRQSSILNTAYINTNIPYLTWNDYDYDGVNRITFYGANLDELPAKQVAFGEGYGSQVYGVTASMIASNPGNFGYIRLPVADTATIAWFYRDPLIKQLAKSYTAIKRPDYLMYVGSGADVKQYCISGATANDPLYLDVSGDGYRPKVAQVREFTTLSSTRAQKFIGEGQHGIIFAEYGGRFGLGSTEWNAKSLNAWNVLGEDYVTVAPLGHCTIDVNEDVIIADSLPFMATQRKNADSTAFGDFSDATVAADTGKSLSHRMTIRSETEREIRVIRGTVLDLSGFGQGNRRQEIAFDGKIKLVIEQGGGIRFPTPGTAAEEALKGGVVLYFNGESQLVFEGVNEAVAARYPTVAASDENRIKILGKGQIWLNKNAKFKVMGTASVAVQADAETLKTDVTISMQRQSQFLIGDANLSGGVFQVGNTVAVDGAEINFTLAINGADALFHTDREGFFGLGAGIVNKLSSKPNGSAAATNNPELEAGKARLVTGKPVFNPDGDGKDMSTGNAWQVIPLSNVKNITVTLTNGIIEHKNIYAGNDSNSSLWAIGPFSGNGTFKLNSGASAIVRGGGNLMLVPALPEEYLFFPVCTWDYAGTMADTGETYGILASAPLMSARAADITTNVTAYQQGKSFAFTTAADLFGFLNYKDYTTQIGNHYVTLGSTQFDTSAGFISKDLLNVKYPADVTRIVRLANPTALNGKITEGCKLGALDCQVEGTADPARFTIIGQ